MTDLKRAEFQPNMIIERLRSGNPEPLIEFMREDGDMSKFDSRQLDVVAEFLRGLTESYFQTKCREELAVLRERVAEIQQNAIESNPKYLEHEKRYPGRVAHFMNLADDHLDEAERLIPGMEPGPHQKERWIIFCKLRELADHCVRQALWDPAVQRAIAWQTAVKKERGPRWPELDDDIRAVLKKNPKASDQHIWNRLPDEFDSRAYYVEDDKIMSESGRELQFGGFKKRVSKIRKEFKKPG